MSCSVSSCWLCRVGAAQAPFPFQAKPAVGSNRQMLVLILLNWPMTALVHPPLVPYPLPSWDPEDPGCGTKVPRLRAPWRVPRISAVDSTGCPNVQGILSDSTQQLETIRAACLCSARQSR